MRTALLSIRDRMDRAGVMLSGLCAVHCVLSIVLVSFLGLGGGLLLAPSIHRVGLALAIGIGVMALGVGVTRHGRTAPLVVGVIGLTLMASGLIVSHGLAEAMLTIPGVLLVALAHIGNLRHAA